MTKALSSRLDAARIRRNAVDTRRQMIRRITIFRWRGAALLVLAITAFTAHGAYPDRPIRLMVPSSAGSGPDAVARLLATRLTSMLGQQIVADNRAGANGVLASEIVARATPDGYTLLMTSGGHTSNPHIYRKLP